MPILEQFRQKGGSVASLKQQISRKAKAFEPQAQEIVQDEVQTVSAGLPQLVWSATEKWLSGFGLAVSPAQLSSDVARAGKIVKEDGLDDMPGGFDEVFNLTGYFVAAIVASLTAAICGGGGMALIASGPIGWVIGLVIGAIVAILTISYGIDEAKGMAQDWEAPAWLMRRALTEGRMAETRKKTEEQVDQAIKYTIKDITSKLEKQLQKQVEGEIKALSELHQL